MADKKQPIPLFVEQSQFEQFTPTRKIYEDEQQQKSQICKYTKKMKNDILSKHLYWVVTTAEITL